MKVYPQQYQRRQKKSCKKLHSILLLLKYPHPTDLNEWKKLHHDTESVFMQLSQAITDLYQSNITQTKLGDVQVLDIKPKGWEDNGKVLVYTHGGAYIFGSANSTIGIPVLEPMQRVLELFLLIIL